MNDQCCKLLRLFDHRSFCHLPATWVWQDNFPSWAGPDQQSRINTLPAQRPHPIFRRRTSLIRLMAAELATCSWMHRLDLQVIRSTSVASLYHRVKHATWLRRQAHDTAVGMRMCDTATDMGRRAPVAGSTALLYDASCSLKQVMPSSPSEP